MKIAVVALQKNGTIVPATYELIEAAKSLSGELFTVYLGASADPAAELASRGGGTVLTVTDERFGFFNDEVYANAMAELVEKHNFDLVLGPATFYGKALFARLAAVAGGAMMPDLTGITADDGSIVARRATYGGAVVCDVVGNNDGRVFATIRPKIFPESKDGSGEVTAESVNDAVFSGKTVVSEVKSESGGSLNLTEADVVVAAGRGIKGAENIPAVKELADSLGAAFGASRAIVDAGWTEYANQVGQTGKTVNPKLYFAIGISGAIQHLVGMRTSGTIVAINKDKDAPIFSVANYGIVGDAFEIMPALTAKFKKELA